MGAHIDLNADLGEGEATDAGLLGIVTSCNVACGGHAGDPATMAATLELARQNKVTVGAHPSYPDREGFGRRSAYAPASEMAGSVESQLRELAGVAERLGVRLRHVKPHGALYNDAAKSRELADAICEAVRRVDGTLRIVGLPGSQLEHAAARAGLGFLGEGFVDRAYAADGTLVPRSEPGSVFSEASAAAGQAVSIATRKAVSAATGETVELDVATLCIHGDSPGAVASARAVRDALEANGVVIRAPETVA